jgi:hypothetical protein
MRSLVTVACAVVAAVIGAGATVPVAISASSCGASAGWRLTAGAVTFEVSSAAPGYTSVYLVSAAGEVTAELPSIGR